MSTTIKNTSFATLFKKYRLRSEISTLSEFGDLLAEEGMIYETSLFTRWQNGERVPRDRNLILKILFLFHKRNGLQNIQDANALLNSAGQGYLTEIEKEKLLPDLQSSNGNKILQGSLGGLLKDYRIQKGISLEEISLALGLKDTAIINTIESGNEKPSREVIDQICDALELKEQEKNNLLLVGNYLPTLFEIEKARKIAKVIIEKWPFPAILIDFSWRVLLINKQQVRVLRLSHKDITESKKSPKRILEIIFSPKYLTNISLKGKELDMWKHWLIELLIHFKYSQLNRTKEKWYIDLISKMMKNKLFREMWKESQKMIVLQVAKHGKKTLIHPDNSSKRIELYFSVVPLLKDPRFEIEFCNPANQAAVQFFERKD